MKHETFLVTGGNGFIASWVVKYLLEAGYQVNTTVRNTTDSSKIKPLIAIAEKASGKLQIFDADLLNEADFIEPLKNVTILIHCASPFKTTGIKNPQKELIDPAVIGTENVLNAASKTPSVKKVVLTSSVVAIWGDASEIYTKKSGVFSEEYWNNNTSANYQPYPYSKMLAEKRAWELYKTQTQWNLVVINPAFVLGPPISKNTESTSQSFIKSYVDGVYKSGVPELYFGIADVREVAQSHINAALDANSEGRHIISGTVASMLEIGKLIEKEFPNKFKTPTKQLPTFLLYLLGPFLGFSWRFVRNNIGIKYAINNQKSIDKLKIRYRNLNETLRDQIIVGLNK